MLLEVLLYRLEECLHVVRGPSVHVVRGVSVHVVRGASAC